MGRKKYRPAYRIITFPLDELSNLEERNRRWNERSIKEKSKIVAGINLKRITPLLDFPISIKRESCIGINPTWLIFEEKPLPSVRSSREKTSLPGLIRIRLDPIYSQLTEKDVAGRGESIVSISRRKGISFAGIGHDSHGISIWSGLSSR